MKELDIEMLMQVSGGGVFTDTAVESLRNTMTPYKKKGMTFDEYYTKTNLEHLVQCCPESKRGACLSELREIWNSIK